MAHWRKDANPRYLTQALAAAETSPGAGSFASFEFSEQIILLGSAVGFNEQVPPDEARRIMNQAVFAAAKSRALTPDGLIRQISIKEGEYLRLPKERFLLRTGISLSSTLGFCRYRLNEATISIGAKLTPKAAKARRHLIVDAEHSIVGAPPTDYLPVAVSIRARTPDEAGSKALDALDLLRSIWNLGANRQRAWRHSSGRIKPVNTIFLAPIHSIHKPDGSLAIDAWWYDPDYTQPVSLLSDKAKFSRLRAFDRLSRQHLRQLPYAQAWEAAALRYGRALDSRDLSNSFLRLWGVLETLTGSISSPASVAVRRAAFLFHDRSRAAAVLSFLADFRNRFVHAGSESSQIEALLYLLKRHVESLLVFHLGFRHRFASIGEACEFLDLPPSKQELARRIQLLKRATTFVTAP